MTQLSIQLSESVKAIAESRAASGHSSLDAYVESLIIADSAEDFDVPGHLRVRSEEQLIRMLEDGEASPAREMTNSDWDAMRARIANSGGSSKGE